MTSDLTTNPKPFCFVLMPFSAKFDDIYAFGIRGACDDAGVYCERVDEQIFQGSVLERIFNQIARADVIVADMSDRSPNVFYEVGYAHALGKRTILLTQEASDIPFDLKHFPHIVYGAKIKDLRSELSKRVQRFAFEKTAPQQYELGLEIYCGDKALARGDAVAQFDVNEIPNASVSIHNASALTYEPGDFRVGIVAPNHYSRDRHGRVAITALPDGTQLHMLPPFETLFPGAYCSADFILDTPSKRHDREVKVTIRVFSRAGSRDYPLMLRRMAGVKGSPSDFGKYDAEPGAAGDAPQATRP
jgi:hypothetical protein